MQFTNILAVVSFAAMAIAAPTENLEARTTGGDIQNQCSGSTKASCCNTLQSNKLIAALGINAFLGVGCNTIGVIDVLGTGACSGKTAVACCGAGTQYGLVNVQSVCVPVNA
ncbi:MAG: hypothetical protein Q9168_005990 [Polycauliona sp. 1 TL-2023]